MSNGKYILTKIGQILESSSVITNFVAEVDNHPAIWVAKTNPVGNLYPQITMDIDFLGSHAVFPSQEAILTIDTWLSGPPPANGVSQALSKLKPINDTILNLLQFRGGQSEAGVNTCITEINKEENIGLRVSRCLKTFRKDLDYDTVSEKIFATITFSLLISENENFQKSYGDPIII